MNRPNVLTNIHSQYAQPLWTGALKTEGINHDLHYIARVPEMVFYCGVPTRLLTLELIECELEGIGWVALSEDVEIFDGPIDVQGTIGAMAEIPDIDRRGTAPYALHSA